MSSQRYVYEIYLASPEESSRIIFLCKEVLGEDELLNKLIAVIKDRYGSDYNDWPINDDTDLFGIISWIPDHYFEKHGLYFIKPDKKIVLNGWTYINEPGNERLTRKLWTEIAPTINRILDINTKEESCQENQDSK